MQDLEAHINTVWGVELSKEGIQELRIGSILYGLSPKYHLVIAKKNQSLICEVAIPSSGFCSKVLAVDIEDSSQSSLRQNDLLISSEGEKWSVINKNKYPQQMTTFDIRVVDKSIKTLIGDKTFKQTRV